MKYLKVVDASGVSKGDIVFGDGKKFQADSLRMLKWVYKSPTKMTNISNICSGTGIARMNIHWLLTDARIRGEDSTLIKVAKQHNMMCNIDKQWNVENKYKRNKDIISVDVIR